MAFKLEEMGNFLIAGGKVVIGREIAKVVENVIPDVLPLDGADIISDLAMAGLLKGIDKEIALGFAVRGGEQVLNRILGGGF